MIARAIDRHLDSLPSVQVSPRLGRAITRNGGGAPVAPSVVGGTISGALVIGSTLSLTGSSITGADSTSYSWKIGGVEYGTASTFSPDLGGSCACTVTGTNAAGSTSATTPAVTVDPTPVVIAVGAAAAGLGAVSVVWPTHKTNDIGMLLSETANEAVATGTGFTALSPVGTGTAAATDAVRLSMQWKRATSAAEPDVAIADAGDHVLCRIITVRGCPTGSTPVSVLASQTLSVAASPMSWIDATTAVDNTLVGLALAHPEDTAAAGFAGFVNASLSGFIEQTDAGTALGNGGGLFLGTAKKATAGAIGVSTSTTTRTLPLNIAQAILGFVPA
jgi:hypothetical protein